METSSLVCYMNWVADVGQVSDATDEQFEVGAPASNMLTERPGQVAIHTGGTPSIEISISGPFDEGAESLSVLTPAGLPVGVIAMINTNVLLDAGSANGVLCTVYDESGNSSNFMTSDIDFSGDGYSQMNLYWVIRADRALSDGSAVAADLSKITHFAFTFDSDLEYGTRNQWSSTVATAPFKVGTVVAGPAFRPERGVRLMGYSPGVSDISNVIRSIGGTVWASPQVRLRRLQAEFTALSETEIEAQPPDCGMRQLAVRCGVSRPLLIIPSVTNAQRSHQQFVFGYISEDWTWTAVDKSDTDGALEPYYKVTLAIIEAK